VAALVDRAPLLAPLVVVAGPTASGKTALALALAEQFSGEIVSCDSVAVYRGMEIGTAKPTLAERARVPHHLIDVAEPDQPCTAGDYSRLAREAIAGITQRGHLPIVAGGTGPLPARAARWPVSRAAARHEPLRAKLRAARPAEIPHPPAPHPHPPRPRRRQR
jgi:tRNA dimethylallyltransferase